MHWWEKNKIKLPKDKDRRRALSDKQRKEIKQLYNEGFPIREIARRFNGICSRRLIQFVLFPERERKCRKQFKEREQYKTSYEKVRGEKWARIMREHRRYKNEVLKDSRNNNDDNSNYNK